MKVLVILTICTVAYAQHNKVSQYDDLPPQPYQQQQPPQKHQLQRIHNENEIEDNLKRSTTTWIPILEYNKEQGQDGSYRTSYKTGNNIDAQESGYIKDISETHPNGIFSQEGEYTYTDPNGETVNVKYTADENGFRPYGLHLPTPPTPSQEILKALEQIYAGIKLQKEQAEQRAKNDPEFAKTQQSRAELDYLGQYYGQ